MIIVMKREATKAELEHLFERLTSLGLRDEAIYGSEQVFLRLREGNGETLQVKMGLANDWVVGVIKQVGNYGEIFERSLGPDTPFDMARGPNELWTNGGLMYAPPYR